MTPSVNTSTATPANPAIVGRFSFDGSHISGPETYMAARGMKMLDDVRAGIVTHVMREGYRLHGDAVLAIMVALQTDYAAFRGEQEFMSGRAQAMGRA